MSADRRPSSSSLEPPERKDTADPGAHELESSDSTDEHFSDAHSDPEEPSNGNRAASPIPRTRVERVDSEPAHGEVPGTDAYKLRTEDAVPDEITVNSPARSRASSIAPSPVSPTSQSVPKTIVDEADDSPDAATQHQTPRSHSNSHKADAAPDLIRKPDGTGAANPIPTVSAPSESAEHPVTQPQTYLQATGDDPASASLKSPAEPRQRRKSSVASRSSALDAADGSDDDFGDDFDDFEEGDEDADFGEFDDGFQQPVQQPAASVPPPVTIPSFPILDIDGLDSEDIIAATEPYLDALYPPDLQDLPSLPSPPKENPIFFNPRSASLWSQLAAPPPLQPPDWVRSPIRRLFLVSLGVPVDLDEIFPTSKQKKLVLPSLDRLNPSSTSPRTSSDSRSVSRLRKDDANTSSVSVDSQGKERPSTKKKPKAGDVGAGSGKGRGASTVPELDLVSATQLCETTDEALTGMTDGELQAHVKRLESLESVAKDVLEYWKQRADEKIGDREAFEGVIENLVKHARKTRK